MTMKTRYLRIVDAQACGSENGILDSVEWYLDELFPQYLRDRLSEVALWLIDNDLHIMGVRHSGVQNKGCISTDWVRSDVKEYGTIEDKILLQWIEGEVDV